jgi:hypothetical protein
VGLTHKIIQEISSRKIDRDFYELSVEEILKESRSQCVTLSTSRGQYILLLGISEDRISIWGDDRNFSRLPQQPDLIRAPPSLLPNRWRGSAHGGRAALTKVI